MGGLLEHSSSKSAAENKQSMILTEKYSEEYVDWEKVIATYEVDDDTSVNEAIGIIANDIELDSTLQLVIKTLDVTDGLTLNSYTFRSFFLGVGPSLVRVIQVMIISGSRLLQQSILTISVRDFYSKIQHSSESPFDVASVKIGHFHLKQPYWYDTVMHTKRTL